MHTGFAGVLPPRSARLMAKTDRNTVLVDAAPWRPWFGSAAAGVGRVVGFRGRWNWWVP